MKLLTLLVIAIGMIFGYLESKAQLTLPKFLPSACAGTAIGQIPGATDVLITSIASVGVNYDLGVSTVYTGIDLETGKAAMWMYNLYSPSLDTSVTSLMINFPLPCSSLPSGQIPDSISIGGSNLPIPANTIEGVELINALKTNADYQAFVYAYPDSLPLIAVISVLPEAFLTYPAGTPYWELLWAPADSTGSPFFCFVQGFNGETVCFSGIPVSVSEQLLTSNIKVYPNPANETMMVELPSALIGHSINIEAFSPSGQRVVLSDGQRLTSTGINVPTKHLTSGIWYLRITDASSISLATSKLVIIQH